MPDAPSLDAYNRKRDFTRSAEPRGERAAAAGHRFVVQKHDATRLHYDFRLELDGVLLSWAVTRGPSLDPAQKRLAVRVEDHPVSYAGFEGTIAEGNYGAGAVMLWDRVTWTPQGEPHAALEAGKLRFTLNGERMHGDWLLIRMRGGKRENWLLRKVEDEEAGAADALTDEYLTSVESGRSMEEIAGKPRSKAKSGSGAPSGKSTRAAGTSRGGRTAAEAGGTQSSSRAGARGAKGAKGANGAKPSKTAGAGTTAITVHGVRISNPDRKQYPEAGLSKRDLVAYYEAVAEPMLAHLRGRPLTLKRCPRGADAPCFVQQHAAPGFPQAVRRVAITESSGERAEHLFVVDLAGMLACVQMGVLEFHGWAARAEAIERPDRLVLDLDPDPALPFADVVAAARHVRDRLEQDGIASWPMLSGGKGIHVVALLAPTGWDGLAAYAGRIAEELERDAPERFTAGSAKAERHGRIYVDHLRNERGATAILPFSTRARPNAPVAMPLGWDALDGIDSAQAFTVGRILDEGLPDHADIACPPQRLPRLRPKGS